MFYFLMKELNEKVPTNVWCQHLCVVIAQGLNVLNIKFSGNRNFLPYFEDGKNVDMTNTKYLITYEPVENIKKSVFIITCHAEDFINEVENFSKKGNKRHIRK